MDSLLTKGITYGALERTLLLLGFQEETYETHRLYKKQEQGAIIVLPRNIQMSEVARAVHLLTARHTVTGMGIAGEAEFENLLAASNVPDSAPVLPSNNHSTRRNHSAIPRTPVSAVPVEAS